MYKQVIYQKPCKQTLSPHLHCTPFTLNRSSIQINSLFMVLHSNGEESQYTITITSGISSAMNSITCMVELKSAPTLVVVFVVKYQAFPGRLRRRRSWPILTFLTTLRHRTPPSTSNTPTKLLSSFMT